MLHYFLSVFCLLVEQIKLSVPVQVIDWKYSSVYDLYCVDGDVKPYSLTRCSWFCSFDWCPTDVLYGLGKTLYLFAV